MNKDPYVVLGVSRDADDDTVKKAYRELAKKYHPDNYSGNPDFSKLAEEKMKEINEAYDEIKKQRVSSSTGAYNGRAYNNYSETSYDTSGHAFEYSVIRRLINSGNIDEASERLNEIPRKDRGAEWNFLYGCICIKKGWIHDARRHLGMACAQAPDNAEYRNVYDNLVSSAESNSRRYQTGDPNASGCSGCDICTGLLCADCCCECLGGDIIPCC